MSSLGGALGQHLRVQHGGGPNGVLARHLELHPTDGVAEDRVHVLIHDVATDAGRLQVLVGQIGRARIGEGRHRHEVGFHGEGSCCPPRSRAAWAISSAHASSPSVAGVQHQVVLVHVAGRAAEVRRQELRPPLVAARGPSRPPRPSTAAATGPCTRCAPSAARRRGRSASSRAAGCSRRRGRSARPRPAPPAPAPAAPGGTIESSPAPKPYSRLSSASRRSTHVQAGRRQVVEQPLAGDGVLGHELQQLLVVHLPAEPLADQPADGAAARPGLAAEGDGQAQRRRRGASGPRRGRPGSRAAAEGSRRGRCPAPAGRVAGSSSLLPRGQGVAGRSGQRRDASVLPNRLPRRLHSTVSLPHDTARARTATSQAPAEPPPPASAPAAPSASVRYTSGLSDCTPDVQRPAGTSGTGRRSRCSRNAGSRACCPAPAPGRTSRRWPRPPAGGTYAPISRNSAENASVAQTTAGQYSRNAGRPAGPAARQSSAKPPRFRPSAHGNRATNFAR